MGKLVPQELDSGGAEEALFILDDEALFLQAKEDSVEQGMVGLLCVGRYEYVIHIDVNLRQITE